VDVLFGDGKYHVLYDGSTDFSFPRFSSSINTFFHVVRRGPLDGLMPLLETAVLVIFAFEQREQEAVATIFSDRFIHRDFVVKHCSGLALP